MLMRNDKLLAQGSLQVQTRITLVEEVLHWFETLVSSFLSSEQLCKCEIALTEGFTNVVNHAHQTLSSTTPIDLEVKVFSKSIEMRIWDFGAPFDFKKKLKELKSVPDDPWREDGRGLILISKLMDDFSYIRTVDNRNCLVMKKTIVVEGRG